MIVIESLGSELSYVVYY